MRRGRLALSDVEDASADDSPSYGQKAAEADREVAELRAQAERLEEFPALEDAVVRWSLTTLSHLRTCAERVGAARPATRAKTIRSLHNELEVEDRQRTKQQEPRAPRRERCGLKRKCICGTQNSATSSPKTGSPWRTWIGSPILAPGRRRRGVGAGTLRPGLTRRRRPATIPLHPASAARGDKRVLAKRASFRACEAAGFGTDKRQPFYLSISGFRRWGQFTRVHLQIP